MSVQVSKKIYELRKNKDMTQEELASEMGVSIAAVSKWETGNSLPDLLMLCSIADFFEVSTDELLGREKHKKKAIVVDDAPFMRETLKKILSDNGYEVIGEAEDGNELLKILKTKKADIITLDVNMPGMGGIEALEHVRNDYPNINVFMCTAVTDKDIVDSALALGASGYVTKPFLPETIIASLSMKYWAKAQSSKKYT